MSDIQSVIRALPRNADTLKDLLIAVDCYASDLYRATKDGNLGAVSDLLTEAFSAFEAYEESVLPLPPMTREEWRDEQAGMDAYRRDS